MKIGELSRRTGVSIRMLRYYEAAGFLAPHRTHSGYRDYGSADEETIERIKRLGAAGMTLETIRKVIPCVISNQPAFTPCDDLRFILAKQMSIIDKKIENLHKSRGLLVKFLENTN